MQATGRRWQAFYARHIERGIKSVFEHVEKIIIGTLIISAGAHVSSTEPAIQLFGYLRHSFVGLGVELFGIALLVMNFIDGLFKLSKRQWHTALQIILAVSYFALSVRLIQLILAFRGE
ncbi:hypothetical protein [Bradyrhizobium sp. 2TAF24]|uniref:hypothetical protein n=1 Tax=Bradyrhizobium sp. 2TAF24 TaxID=3233011 RepID=UPI003F92BCBF